MRAKGLKIKIPPVLRARSEFLKVLIMVKVVKALTKPSIKGKARNVVQVFNDRLFSVLGMLKGGQSCCHDAHLATPAPVSFDSFRLDQPLLLRGSRDR